MLFETTHFGVSNFYERIVHSETNILLHKALDPALIKIYNLIPQTSPSKYRLIIDFISFWVGILSLKTLSLISAILDVEQRCSVGSEPNRNGCSIPSRFHYSLNTLSFEFIPQFFKWKKIFIKEEKNVFSGQVDRAEFFSKRE